MEAVKYSRETGREEENVKRHPIETANIITKSCFCWMIPDFVKGFKKELTADDMYGPLKSHEASMLGNKLQETWNYEVTHKKNPSLWVAMLKVFGLELALYALFFLFLEFIVKLSQPLVVSEFLKYYEPNQTEMTIQEAYMYAALLILSTFGKVYLTHTYVLRTLHLSMKIRVATCSLIYRKALKLSTSSLAQTTIGQMVNLLSNDVSRFDSATQHINYLWVSPIETIIVMYLVYSYVGPAGVSGTCFLLLFIPLQMYMGKLTSRFRLRTALRTDERIRLMSEIVTGIQVIKMYTWEKPFAKLVEISRRKEMDQIRNTTTIRAMMMSFNLVLNRAAICVCILTFVLTGNTLTATYAYTISSFYANIRQVVTKAFPKAVTQISETTVSVQRITKFLLYEEIELNNESNQGGEGESFKKVEEYQNGLNGSLPLTNTTKSIGVHLDNVSVKWIMKTPDYTIERITFNADANNLVAIVGPVGAGKTTFLHVILKELPPIDGTVHVKGTISYSAQEPWLFGGSIRQNIIFGQKFEPKRYAEVVRVCALERDFSLFPHGDLTLVGNRGVTLSGGQRARINLARAIYKESDIYLLDDPLSAVDTHVGKQLFEDCICGYLKNKCVILVTHRLQYLRDVEKIYLLQDGRVTCSGSYSELQTFDNEFMELLADKGDGETVAEDTKTVEQMEKKQDTDEKAPAQEREQTSFGVITWHVYNGYLRAGGSWCKILVLIIALIVTQVFASTTDYFVNIWVNLEQQRMTSNATVVTNSSDFNKSVQILLNRVFTEDSMVIIYTCLVLTTIVLVLTRTIYFFRYAITASTVMHNSMFNKIIYGTMKFFNTNPPGRILNRFSKDIGSVDESLPLTLLDTVETALNVLAIVLVIASLNPWILLPTLVILVIFYFLKLVFLSTSRAIKRVEATTRSPIYTHLTASLQGLTTIRAFGAQEILKKEFENFQNQNSAPCFLFLAANRTFGFWLDVHCVIYIALVTISILFIEKEIFGGNVGLALTQSISLTGMFQWGVRQWSELENNMTSVERVQEYIDMTPEKDVNIKDPPRFWPEEGNVKFENLYLRYSAEDPYVLKNLTFAIQSKEKIGIVGRTGAGKSSLISALFRLTQIDGKILIDNVNTQEISLATLRSKISIIPQEPVLFSGTLRKNLDPFDDYNDDVLWSALAEVELKNAVTILPAGLDSTISEGGSNFSVGQRQLLCLARAIIRNNKILVLDEATANVDPHTDALIQTTIRAKFADCTVLTIAHRLLTIMDSDKVLVMDAGEAVEFDHPHKLLQNSSGLFYGLVLQTGSGMASNLIAVAKENYKD